MANLPPPMFCLSWAALDRQFGPVSDGEKAERLGVTRNSVVRARRHGLRLTPRRAEELAVRAGWLPEEVWGASWRWSEEAWAAWRAGQVAVRNRRRDERLRRRRGERFWGWPDWYRVRPHRCAVDGCRCGLREEVAA